MARSRPGLSFFTLTALVLLILAVPADYSSIPRPLEMNLFLILWVGAALTSALSYISSTGLVLSLFPCFQAFLIASGYSPLLELGFFTATLVGAFALSMRRGMKPVTAFRQGVVLALVTMASLRITGFLFRAVFPEGGTGYLGQVLRMTFLLPPLVFLNLHLRALVKLRPLRHEVRNLRIFAQITILPLLTSPLLAPAAADLSRGAASLEGPWLLIMSAGILAVLAIQTGSTSVFERSRYARGRAFESERAMAELSRNLASCDSILGALGHLARAWYATSSPAAVRVTWRNISFTFPSDGIPEGEAPLRRTGSGGIEVEVWPAMDTSLDPDRMDSFISLTESTVTGLELHRSVTARAWDFMEAMVYSLDRSDHRLSGYSKRVAEVAMDIGNHLLLQPGVLENLHMAALLHQAAPLLVSGERERQTSFSETSDSAHYHLPAETLEALIHMRENFDGSGEPQGLRDGSIPLLARILSVAASFVNAAQSMGRIRALQEIVLRRGRIYDPAVVDVLVSMEQEDDTGLRKSV
jgi:HD-GYP domain-containing protein (c-di-GMP phosphodiesterase class II)